MEQAVLVLASDRAPWYCQKMEYKALFLRELLHPECIDLSRFKRHVKAFCGGKKKGQALSGNMMGWSTGSQISRGSGGTRGW